VILVETSVVLYVLTSVVRIVSTGPGTEIVSVTSFVTSLVTSLVCMDVGPGVSIVCVGPATVCVIEM
jgi:hypothetical protein